MFKRFAKILQGFLTYAACTIQTIFWFGPVMVLALLKFILPVPAIRRVLTRWVMIVGECWVATNAAIFAVGNSTRWEVNGAENLNRNGWYLVVANHQTWVDIVAMQTVLNRKIPFLKFFIKQELIWFPFLGLSWWAMDMPFMKRYSKSYLAKYPEKKGKDLEITRKACLKFRDTPTSVINFVEGTRFTEQKRHNRRSPYRHLLAPKAGGVALAFSAMGDCFDAVLDVTLFYPYGPPNFWQMMCGDFRHIVIDIRQRPVDAWVFEGDYENDRAFRQRFHRWIAEIWQEKDQRLEDLGTALTDRAVC